MPRNDVLRAQLNDVRTTVLLTWISACGIAHAEPCAPSAIVSGEPVDAGNVARELEARGIASRQVAGCALIRARVTRGEGELVVEIVDQADRRETRRVASAASAATVIESWARTDLTAGLVGPPRAAPLVDPEEDPAPRLVRAPLVAVAAESSLGSDGSLWAGARVAGCVHVGVLCLGVMLRFAADPGWMGDAHEADGERLATDMLLGLEFSSRSSRFVVAPGVGIGVGWLRTYTHEPDGDTISADFGGVRADADVRVGTPLTRGLWLSVIASASYLPAASTSGLVMHDDALVAAEPRGFLRLSVGLSSSEAR